MRDYGAESQNWSGLQDDSGRMLFGNNGCILEFDGQLWIRIPVPGGSYIRGLAKDANGRIWVGGVNTLGYLRLTRNEYEFVSVKDQLPAAVRSFGTIWNIQAHQGWVYIYATGGLIAYDGTEFKPLVTPGDPEHYRALSSTGQHLFLHVQGQPLYEVSGTALKPVLDAPELEDDRVDAVLEMGPGDYLLCLRQAGMFRWSGNRLTPFSPPLRALLQGRKLYDARRLGNGDLLV